MKRSRVLFVSLCVLGLLLPAPFAGAKNQPAKPDGSKPAVDMGKSTVDIGNISVDKATRSIRMKVKTALKEGILEFLLVSEQGKTYESAFEVEGNMPSELNFALILIGCEAAPYDKFIACTQKEGGQAELFKSYPASLLSLKLLQNGKPVSMDSVIHNREGKPSDLIWVYTGGQTIEGRFAPDGSRNFIAIWPNLASVVNLFSANQNPYRGPYGFDMNTENKKLDKGQEYTLVIERRVP
ncbi:MAG: YdjY domain-containing protein [Thermodesulfobacteriota bacterium]